MGKRSNGEGSISKRPDGRWAAVLSVQTGTGRKRRFFYGKTQQEALAKLSDARRQLESGVMPADGRLTVAQLMRSWLEETVKPNRRTSTYVSYRVNVENHIIPALGAAKVAKLQAIDVRRFLNVKLESGLSPRTVQYIRTNLRSALKQAVADGLVGRNVADLVSGPTVTRAEISPLSPAQVGAFLAHVRGDRLESLYVAAYTLGLRQGELLGLRWEHVDLEGGTLRVAHALQRGTGVVFGDTKSQKSRRTLALPAITAEALRVHRIRQNEERLKSGPEWQDHNLVFTTKLGTPLDHRNVAHYFQRHLAKAGLPAQRFHDARHACATFLLSQGVPLKIVQEILGHSSIQLTADTYAHVLPQLQRDAMATFDRVLGTSANAS